MANRFDIFTAKAVKRDNNGFMVVKATPTRAGIFIYHEMDETGKINQVRELRHPDEVFSQTTLDSLNSIPYTIQENHVALINPNDARGKTYGFTLTDARKEEDHSAVSIKVLDEAEIEVIETSAERSDNLELSNGYTCDVVKEPGEFNGEKFDARQTNIKYNHVARVSNARGGGSCRIRLDSKGAICGISAERIDSDDVSEKPNGESIMKMIQLELPKVKVGDFRLDADEVEFPDEHKGVVNQLKKREKSLVKAFEGSEEKFDSLNEELTKNKAQIDVLTVENKDLKEANENSIPAEKLDSAVRQRAKYLNYATVYKLDKAEEMSNDEILTGIVKASKKVQDESKLEDMTYTKAVFDMLDHEYEQKKIAANHNLDHHRVDSKDGGEMSEFDKAKKKKGVA